MDFIRAVLYFYLMFPVFSTQQNELIYKFGKKELSVSQQQSIRNEIQNFLFPADEEELIIETEENAVTETDVSPETFIDDSADLFPDENDFIIDDGIPLPDNLENPQFGPQSAGSELLETNEQSEEEKISIAEEQYANSLNKLSRFKYGEEQFAVNERNGKKKTLVTVNNDTVIRTRYDEDFYVKDRIVWKNALTVKDSVILSSIKYEYVKGKDNKKIAVSKIEEYPVDKKGIETVYDKNGNPVEIIYYHMEKDTSAENVQTETEEPVVIPEKKIEDRKIVRKYDSQNRLVSEEEATVYEEPDPKRRGQKIKKAGSKKNVYTYTAKSSVPDYIYYENGKMRIAVNYIEEDVYEQTLYFENDFSVRARYNHGRKVREVFYSGMNEIKRTNFD